MHSLTIGIAAAVYTVVGFCVAVVYYEDAESTHEQAFAVVTGIFWPLYMTFLAIAAAVVALAKKRTRR